MYLVSSIILIFITTLKCLQAGLSSKEDNFQTEVNVVNVLVKSDTKIMLPLKLIFISDNSENTVDKNKCDIIDVGWSYINGLATWQHPVCDGRTHGLMLST